MNTGKSNIIWMKGSLGISVHWTARTVSADGNSFTFQQAVDAFDPQQFAKRLAETGAQHCIFTLTHADQYLALPHPVLDKLLPGRTTKRDLIGELIEALTAQKIRMIAYYNHSCNNHSDMAWEHACGYSSGIKGNLDRFAENICTIVSYIARRYDRGIHGWWFDSSYSVDPRGPNNSVSCEMGSWQFPWSELSLAAKNGYQDCAVTFNAGVNSNFLYSPYQDYYAGETETLDGVFTPTALSGFQDHRWLCTDSPDWVFSKKNYRNGFAQPRFTDAELDSFQMQLRMSGRMVTFNLQIDQTGKINEEALKQIGRLSELNIPSCR